VALRHRTVAVCLILFFSRAFMFRAQARTYVRTCPLLTQQADRSNRASAHGRHAARISFLKPTRASADPARVSSQENRHLHRDRVRACDQLFFLLFTRSNVTESHRYQPVHEPTIHARVHEYDLCWLATTIRYISFTVHVRTYTA
jgi:hypothetical protein